MEEIKTTVKFSVARQWRAVALIVGIERRLDNAAEAATISESRIYQINSFRERAEKSGERAREERRKIFYFRKPLGAYCHRAIC